MIFQDKTFCKERGCSFFPSCERAWTDELDIEARKYQNIEIWFFLGRPVCFNKGWDFILKEERENGTN